MIRFYWLLLLLFISPQFANAAEYELRAEEVEQAVANALAKADVAEFPKATITNNRAPVLYRGEEGIEVEINQLTHNPHKLTWTANMLLLKDKSVVTARPLTGKYEAQKAIPVLKERLSNGHIITADDLSVRYVAGYKVPYGTIDDPNKLIGLTPARIISKDRPIREQELNKPTIVKKGTTIQMLYQTTHIEIQTIGEAMDDGALNDIIRVRNHNSQNIVRAKVISSNQVMAGAI